MEYPYFVAPMLEALRKSDNEEEKATLRCRIAVNIGDEGVLRHLFQLDSGGLLNFYPDMTMPDPSTSDTIDAFLDRYSRQDSRASMDILPMAPAIDYASMMLGEAPIEPVAKDSLSPFAGSMSGGTSSAAKSESTEGSEQCASETAEESTEAGTSQPPQSLRTIPPRPRRPVAPDPETPALTESFARIMIKNGNYAKALEIITELNLKNPEKSIYFADQIRFLRKLIVNEQKNKN